MPRTNAATYLRNVGKSVGYSMIKEIKDNTPAMSAFASNHSEAIKSAYSAIRHMDKTVSKISTKVLESQYGEVGKYALKNIKEDLKSGKFYNMERIKDAEGSALSSMGMNSDDDFGFEDLANGNPDDFDMDGGESLESMMDLVGKKSSEAVSDAVIRTTEYAVNAQTELARASAEQNKAMYANLHAALGTINENVGKLIEVANGPMTTHFENSQKFFEAETKLSEERNAILKEMLELQRGIYSPKKKTPVDGKITMADIMDSNGMPDLSVYFDAIKKNLDTLSMGTGDIIKTMLTPDMLKTMVASPLQYATDLMAKKIFPNMIKQSMKSLDKTVSGAFASIMAKVMNTDYENGFVNALKGVLGIEDYIKKDIDTSKYKKGAVPFDGITRKSIVEVIPTYLARIESAITRSSERRFDFDTGKFVSVDDIKKMSNRDKKSAMDSANFDVKSYIDKYMKSINFGNAKNKKEVQANIDRILSQSFDTGILFNPNEKHKMASDYKMEGKNLEYQLELIRKMFAAIPKEVVTAYAKNVYEAKGSYSRTMRAKEESGTSIENALWNNSMKGMRYDRSNQTNGFDPDPNPIKTSSFIRNGRTLKVMSSSREQKSKGSGGSNKKDKSSSDDDAAASPADAKFTFDPDDYDSLENGVVATLMTLNEDDSKNSSKSKNSLANKLQKSSKLGEGVKKFVKGIEYLTKKPTDFLAGIIKKADSSIYNLIFGVEYDEETGEKKSISKAIFDGLKDTFNEFKEWMREYVFDPIKKYFDKEGTLGNKAKKFVQGKYKEFKQSNFGQRFFDTFKRAGNYTKNLTMDSVGKAFRDENEGETFSAVLEGLQKGDATNKASGARRINKTGLAVLSEGEMVIPPDLNPLNIDKRTKKENKAKKSFFDSFIPNFGAGKDRFTVLEGGAGKRAQEEASTFTIAEEWNKKMETNLEGAKEEFSKLSRKAQDKIIRALKKYELGKKAGELTKSIGGTLKNAASSVLNRGLEAWDSMKGEQTEDQKARQTEQRESMKLIAKNGMQEIQKYAPEVAAGALLGGGISWATGAIGGPLVGAAVGAGISLLKHSEQFNQVLFGDVGEDGKRHGGLIEKVTSKNISQTIQKYAPSMGKGAILGGVSSFILPFGPLAGIMLGSAAGFAKENEEIKNALFGEGKLFSKDFPEKVKKALPVMGAGALVGAVAGPFGLFPNLVLGSAAGLGATTDKFKDFMFGKEDKDGNRQGGLIENAVKNMFKPLVDFTTNTIGELTKWATENIKKPLIDAVDPIKKQFKLIFEGIHQGINKLFEDHLGATFDKLLEKYVFQKISGFIKKITGLALAPAKFLISAPFKLVGAVGDSLRNRQIKRGQADYMTADQRLAFREKRGKLRNLNLTSTARKWQAFDVDASDVSGQESGDIADAIDFTLDQAGALDRSKKAAYQTYTDKVRKHKKLDASQVNTIAKSIKDYVEKGKGTPQEAAKKAHKKIAMFKGLSDPEKKELADAVNEFLGSVTDYQKRAKKFGNNREALLEALNKSETFKNTDWTKFSDKDLKRASALLRKEQDAKTVTGGDEDGDGSGGQGLVGSIPKLDEAQQKRHEDLMDFIKPIKENIESIAKADTEKAKDTAEKLSAEYEKHKEEIENAFMTKFTQNLKEVFTEVTDDIADKVGTGVYYATHNAIVGNKDIDWRNPETAAKRINKQKNRVTKIHGLGQRLNIFNRFKKGSNEEDDPIEQAAGGIDRVSKTGIIAVSEGELIIPPDLNPFNTRKRKRDEDKAKKDFANSIFGYAEGGEVGEDDSNANKNPSLFDKLRGFIKNKKDGDKDTKFEFNNGRPYKLIKDDKGEWILDKSDSETVNSMKEDDAENESRKSMFKQIADMPKTIIDSVRRAFYGDEAKQEKKDGGILSKLKGILGLAGSAVSAIGSTPVGTAALAIGGAGVGSMLWDGFKDTEIGKALINWFDESNIKQRALDFIGNLWETLRTNLPKIFEEGLEVWTNAFQYAATNIFPKIATILIEAAPSILMGVVKGIGSLLKTGFDSLIAAIQGKETREFGYNADSVSNTAKAVSGGLSAGVMALTGKASGHKYTMSNVNQLENPDADINKAIESTVSGMNSLVDITKETRNGTNVTYSTDKAGSQLKIESSDITAANNIAERNAANGTPDKEITQEEIDAERKTLADNARQAFEQAVSAGTYLDIEETKQYKDLADVYKPKVDASLKQRAEDGTDSIQFTDDDGVTHHITYEQLLQDKENKSISVKNPYTGESEYIAPAQLLDPTYKDYAADLLGLDYRLTYNEARQNAYDQGLVSDKEGTTPLDMAFQYISKAALKGRNVGKGMAAAGKGLRRMSYGLMMNPLTSPLGMFGVGVGTALQGTGAVANTVTSKTQRFMRNRSFVDLFNRKGGSTVARNKQIEYISRNQLIDGISANENNKKGFFGLRTKADDVKNITVKGDVYDELLRMEEAGELADSKLTDKLPGGKNRRGKRNIRQARRNIKNNKNVTDAVSNSKAAAEAAQDGVETATKNSKIVDFTERARSATDTATEAVQDGVETASKNSKIVNFAEKAEEMAKRTGRNVAEEVGEQATKDATKRTLRNTIKDTVTDTAKKGLGTAGKAVAATEKLDLVAKIVKWVKDAISKFVQWSGLKDGVKQALKFAKKSTDEKAIGKVIKTLTEICTKTIIPKFEKSILKRGLSFLGKIASKLFTGPLAIITNIAFCAGAFYDGWKNADTTFGITEEVMEPTTTMRLISAIIQVLSELILQGIFSAADIMGFIQPVLKLFGFENKELEEAQEKTNQKLQEYKDETGTEMTLEEYNKRNDLSTKIGNTVNKGLDKLKDGAASLWNTITGKDDKDDKKGDKKEDKKAGAATTVAGAAASALQLATNTAITTNKNNKNVAASNVAGAAASALQGITSAASASNIATMPFDAETLDLVKETKSNAEQEASYIDETIDMTAGMVLTPLTTMEQTGKNMSSLIESYATTGSGILTSVKSDQNTIKRYFNKKNIDDYWKISSKYKNNDFYSSLYTNMALTNRMIALPAIMAAQSIKNDENMLDDIKDEIEKEVKNKLKSSTTTKTKDKDKDKDDKDSAKGSGIPRQMMFHARGSNQKPKSDSKYANDPTFVSQLDSKYANQKFNVQGDTQKQTIADSGCGPAAAAMVVNGAYGQNELDMKTASKEALRYKVKNGGVNAAYFEDTFSSHGLMTKYYIDGSRKQRNEEISSSLKSGNRVVLMGSDRGNMSKVKSPYGPDDHYIVATRMSPDGKYIWVNDPESKVPEVKYPAANILNNTKMGVAGIAANGSGLLRHISAKGSGVNTKLINRLRRYHGRGKYGPDTVQYKVWDGIRSAGFSETATAAAMGNIQHESGFNPSAIEKGSAAGFGLIQWTDDRRTAIENYAAQKGVSVSDLGLQIEYLIKELKNETKQWMTASTKYGFGSLTRNDWENGDLDTATKAFMCCFERPAYSSSVNHIDRRLQSAREYYEAFTGTEPSGSSPSTGDGSGDSSSGGSILDDILGAFDTIGEIWGLKKKGSSGNSSSGGSVSNASSLQEALVEKMKSVEGQLAYSQSSRNPDNGSGDCSSTVQWAYQNVLGVDPGSWTGAQETDSDTYTVTSSFDESQMQPGDLILYNGHVEMYAGDGKMIGHGGGNNGTTPGPTVKPLSDQGRFRMIRRWTGFRDGFDTNQIPEQYRSLAAKGSGISRFRSNRAIDPKKILKIDNTYKSSNQKVTQDNGFVRRSRYTTGMTKDIKIPAGMYAAGTGIDGYSVQGKVPTGIPRTTTTSSSSVNGEIKVRSTGDKVQAYLAAMLKLLAKEVENTTMLSTIVTILTELVKISEEERELRGKTNTEQKQQELNTRRTSILNILKSTGIAKGSDPELEKLISEAQRIAAI